MVSAEGCGGRGAGPAARAALGERSDLEWMELQTRALYLHDVEGRIVASNEPSPVRRPAPWFFLGRTPHGHLWRFRAGLAPQAVRGLARLAAAERVDADVERDPERLAAMLRILREWVDVREVWRGPAFRFPEVLPDFDGVSIGAQDGALVAEFPTLGEALDARLPCFALLDGGRAVSVCYCASLRVPGSPAVEAGVETLPGFRGRGLASRVVAAWARAVRASGCLPLYSTSWGNRGSRAVARKLGLIRYGSDLHIR